MSTMLRTLCNELSRYKHTHTSNFCAKPNLSYLREEIVSFFTYELKPLILFPLHLLIVL